jgi:hypothetical protein
MDKQVFILKLINGDEIFGTIAGVDDNGIITVDNPMSSESRNMSDGSNAMIINRYIPFLRQNSIELSPVSVVCMGEVSNALTEYYYLSLTYAKTIDEALERNIKTASHFMRESLDSGGKIEEIEETNDEEDDPEGKNEFYKMVLGQVKPNGGSFH